MNSSTLTDQQALIYRVATMGDLTTVDLEWGGPEDRKITDFDTSLLGDGQTVVQLGGTLKSGWVVLDGPCLLKVGDTIPLKTDKPEPDVKSIQSQPLCDYPALIIHSINGEPVAHAILHSDSDLWGNSYPMDQLNVLTTVVPLVDIIRFHRMQEALEVIGAQSLGEDWTAEQAMTFVKQTAREVLKGFQP